MAGQSNYDPQTEQAGGFPAGVTVELVNTLRKATRNVGTDRANACKAAYALALLKQHGIQGAQGVVTQVITSMSDDDKAN